MRTLTLKYRPVSIIPLSITKTGSLPQSWAEVTPKQLTAIASLYRLQINDTQFLAGMSGINRRILEHAGDFQRYKLIDYLDFIGDIRPHHEFIIKSIAPRPLLHAICHMPHAQSSMPHAPRPLLPALCPMLYCPQSKLKGVTFGQFIFADSYYNAYQQSKDPSDLNKFIAALYLPSGETFSEKHILKNHKQIGKTDINQREAIAINWQLINEWLSLAYPLIFQKHEQVKTTESEQAEPIMRDTSAWVKVFQNFIGDDILHDELWAAKPIHTIFQYMTRKNKENARRKSNKN